MNQVNLKMENGRSKRRMSRFGLCLIATLLSKAGAILTDQGGITNSSEAEGCTVASLHDGIFKNKSNGSRVCCAFKSDIATDPKWFRFDFAFPKVINTVLLIANEKTSDLLDGLSGAKIYIGFSQTSIEANKQCTPLPTRSGVYECGGISGSLLGLSKVSDVTKHLGICQIRAYSWTHNTAAGFFITNGSNGSVGYETPPCNVLNFPSTPPLLEDDADATKSCPATALFRPGTSGSSDSARYRFTLPKVAFIQALTLVFDKSDRTEFWRVSIAQELDYKTMYSTIELIYTASNSDDKYGKEIIINKQAGSIQIERQSTDSSKTLAFRWVGIFTTANECKVFHWFTSMDTWSSTPADQVIQLQLPSSSSSSIYVGVFAGSGSDTTSYNCPVAKIGTDKNFMPLNGIFRFNEDTGQMAVTYSETSELGSYEFWTTAFLNDGVSSYAQESKLIHKFEVCCNPLGLGLTTNNCGKKNLVFQQGSTPTTDLRYLLSLCDKTQSFIFSSSDSSITISGQTWTNLLYFVSSIINPAKTFTITITSMSLQDYNIAVSLKVLNCTPALSLTEIPSILTKTTDTTYSFSSTTYNWTDIAWTMNAVDASCGSYFVATSSTDKFYFYAYGSKVRFKRKSGVSSSESLPIDLARGADDTQKHTVTITFGSCTPVLTWQTAPSSSKSYIIGVDTNVYINFDLVTSTLCGAAVDYQITKSDGSSAPSFITLETISGNRQIKIYTTDPSDVGSYSIKLKGTSGGQTIEQTINVTVVACTITSKTCPFDTSLTVGATSALTYGVTKTTGCESIQASITHTVTKGGNSVSLLSGTGLSYTISNLSEAKVGEYAVKADLAIGSSAPQTCNYKVTVVSCLATAIRVSTSKITDQTYIISPIEPGKIITMELPTYEVTRASGCSAVAPALAIVRVNSKVTSLPSFITLADKITIKTDDPTLAGEYEFAVTATANKLVDSTAQFKIKIDCLITELLPIITEETKKDLTYTLRGDTQEIALPKYQYKPSTCAKQLIYLLRMTNGEAMPSFVKFDQTKLILKLDGSASSFDEAGTSYAFQLFVRESNGSIDSDEFTFTISTEWNNSAPNFVGEPADIFIKIGDTQGSYSWEIPEVQDINGDNVSVEANFDFAWLDYNDGVFSVDPTDLVAGDAGEYSVTITATDDYDATTSIVQKIVLEPSEVIVEEIYQREDQQEADQTQPGLQENTVDNEIAEETEGFVFEWKPPAPTANADLKTKFKQYGPLSLKPAKVKDDGTITLTFSRPVILNPIVRNTLNRERRQLQETYTKTELDQIKTLLKDSFKVVYKPQEGDQIATLQDYYIKEFTNFQVVVLQLDFDEPLLVSANNLGGEIGLDNLFVSYINKNLLLDPATEAPLPRDIFLNEVFVVPKQQASAGQAASIKQLLSTSQNVVMAVIPGNLVLSILLGISLKKVWQTINILQFLIYFQLWRVNIPANTDKFVDYVAFIARGEFIPKEKIMNKVLAIFHIQATSDKQQVFTRFLIIIVVGVVTIGVLVVLLICILRHQKSGKVKYYLNQLKEQIFWNTILRTFIQMYLDITIVSLTVLSEGQKLSLTTLVINLALMGCAVFFPMGIFILLMKNQSSLSDSDKIKKYGTLYQNVDTSTHLKTTYIVCFLLRRLFFAVLTAFVAKRNGSFGIAMVLILNMYVQVYLVAVQPLLSGNRIELASEILLHYTFLSFVFADLQFSPVSSYNMGWFSVAIIGSLIAINLLNMLIEVFQSAYSSAKLAWISYKRPQHLKDMDKALKEQLEMLQRFESETDLQDQQRTQQKKVKQERREIAPESSMIRGYRTRIDESEIECDIESTPAVSSDRHLIGKSGDYNLTSEVTDEDSEQTPSASFDRPFASYGKSIEQIIEENKAADFIDSWDDQQNNKSQTSLQTEEKFKNYRGDSMLYLVMRPELGSNNQGEVDKPVIPKYRRQNQVLFVKEPDSESIQAPSFLKTHESPSLDESISAFNFNASNPQKDRDSGTNKFSALSISEDSDVLVISQDREEAGEQNSWLQRDALFQRREVLPQFGLQRVTSLDRQAHQQKQDALNRLMADLTPAASEPKAAQGVSDQQKKTKWGLQTQAAIRMNQKRRQ